MSKPDMIGGIFMLINDIWFELRDGRKALLTSPEEKYVDSTLDFLAYRLGKLILLRDILRNLMSSQGKEKRNFSIK